MAAAARPCEHQALAWRRLRCGAREDSLRPRRKPHGAAVGAQDVRAVPSARRGRAALQPVGPARSIAAFQLRRGLRAPRAFARHGTRHRKLCARQYQRTGLRSLSAASGGDAGRVYHRRRRCAVHSVVLVARGHLRGGCRYAQSRGELLVHSAACEARERVVEIGLRKEWLAWGKGGVAAGAEQCACASASVSNRCVHRAYPVPYESRRVITDVLFSLWTRRERKRLILHCSAWRPGRCGVEWRRSGRRRQ